MDSIRILQKLPSRKIETDFQSHVENKTLTIYTIGKKGYDMLKSKYPEDVFNTEYIDIFNDLSFDNVSRVSAELMDNFILGDVDEVFVSYAKFKNAAVQFANCVQFLPVAKLKVDTKDIEKSKRNADYIFEPSKQELLEQLIPSILQTSFQKYCLDTHASEHGARMTAMDSATENANDLLGELKIYYNKARQESITNEILEIVGGAAALEEG